MRIDCARDAPEAVTADVAIVGSGAAGQAAARRLLSRRCSVVLIESGGLDHDEASADFNRGDVVGQPYHPLEHSPAALLWRDDRHLGRALRRI